MTSEKQLTLTKIDTLLQKRTAEMLNDLPDVNEVDDGIIIRFFAKWDNCEDDGVIKFKRIPNHDNPEESSVFFYIPKGAHFDIIHRFYIGCITCLNGAIDITANNETRLLENYSKICVDSDDVQGIAYENTYLVVTSDRNTWSDVTVKHISENY